MKIHIAGAGIAGLTAAIALAKSGHEVLLCERSPVLTNGGAGLLMAPNALRILKALGVDYESCGKPSPQIDILSANGKLLQTIQTAKVLGSHGTTLGFLREELHAALHRALPANVKLKLNAPVLDANNFDADLLIAADGIRSQLRDQLYGPFTLAYSGMTCWRVILNNFKLPTAFELWGGKARVGGLPLTANRSYVYFVLTAPHGQPRNTLADQVAPLFAHLPSPVPEILRAMQGYELLHHDLDELPRIVWGKGRVPLIGDAAHAMTPNQGQGAGMAIEDAFILPQVVAASDPAAELARLRYARVARVKSDSRRFGAMAHWSNPIATALRDRLIRLTPQEFSNKQYFSVIAPGLAMVKSR